MSLALRYPEYVLKFVLNIIPGRFWTKSESTAEKATPRETKSTSASKSFMLTCNLRTVKYETINRSTEKKKARRRKSEKKMLCFDFSLSVFCNLLNIREA